VQGIRPHRAIPQLEQDGEKNNKEVRQFLHYCEENLTKLPLFIPALPGKRSGKCLPRLIAILCSVEPMEKSILAGGLKSAMVSSRQHQYHTNPLLPFEATTVGHECRKITTPQQRDLLSLANASLRLVGTPRKKTGSEEVFFPGSQTTHAGVLLTLFQKLQRK
jgi:hypothetical protein